MPNAYGYTGIEKVRIKNTLSLAAIDFLASISVLVVAHGMEKLKEKIVRIPRKKYETACLFRGETTDVTVHVDRRIPSDKHKRLVEVVTCDSMMNMLYTHILDTLPYENIDDAYLEPDIDAYYEPCGQFVSVYHLKIAYRLKGLKYNAMVYVYDACEKAWADHTKF